MLRAYDKGPDRRHKDLDTKSQSERNDYLKRKGHIRLQSEHITRIRNGRLTVENLEEAEHTIKQRKIVINQRENIWVRTYITIAYLPLEWVVGMFSMNHCIIPDNAGHITFIWLIVISVLATFSLALSLKIIFDAIEKTTSTKKKFKTLRAKQEWPRHIKRLPI